jgi:molecular chaperone DnaJ
VPRLRGYGQGDQHVKVTVVTPTNLTEAQKNLLREFAASIGESTQEQHPSSIFERMKKAILGD